MVDTTKLMTQKEFYSLRYVDTPETPLPIGYVDYEYLQQNVSNVLQLQGHQIFIKNLFNPHTHYKRLLLYQSTGTGKTLVILSIAQMYVEYFKKMRQQPQVTIIGFTEDVMVKELTKFTDFGYISKAEQEQLEKLRTSKSEKDQLRRRGLRATVKRRITDKSRGGYYQFYGYQKFANDLFLITAKGNENKITHNDIYETEVEFHKRIDDYVNKGYINVNRALIESLKYSFVACDEIHQVYNVKSKNNRGMAIQYALDILEEEDPTSSPRVIFASATPLSGSTLEIVDVMNLLIPGANLQRSDFFEKNGKMKPNTLERIGKMSAGYVSFIKDTNVKLYPKRIFEGVELFNIPYLKFTPCPMSKLQQDTMVSIKNIDEIDTLLVSGAYTLYDMVFPNPESQTIGLYNANKVVGTITTAPDKWKSDVGIEIVKGTSTGSFLHYDNISKYSVKYKTLLDEVFNLLYDKEPGKILIYHYYVSGSGVNLVKEMFLQNGFIDATSTPIGNTKCAICGIINKDHGKVKDHQYKPARVLVVYGEMGAETDKNITMFNSRDNAYGYEYRVLIGSRVIQEGKDFNCIRFLYSLSLPRDISTLIQLYGRAVRAKSHLWLPDKYRDVKVYNLVSTFKKDLRSPEILNYQRKMAVYQQIQLIERELRRYAIDNFINYDKMKLPNKPTLDGLPYEPVYHFNPNRIKDQPELTTFRAYGYGVVETDEIIRYLKRLFTYRPVWTYDDLWQQVRHPSILYKTSYDQSTFSEDNFILALDFLVNGTYVELSDALDTNYNVNVPYVHIANETRRVIYQPPYYVLTYVDEIGMPVVDYDSFMRVDITAVENQFSINRYVEESATEANFQNYLDEYLDKYKDDPIMSLVKIHQNFHYTICRYKVEGKLIKGTAELVKLYFDLNLLLTGSSFHSKEVQGSYSITTKDKAIGFKTGDMSFILTNKKWTKVPSSLFITNPRDENEYIVGYSKQTSSGVEFKIRDSMTSKTYKSFKDKRKVQKGIICDSVKMSRKNRIADELKVKVGPRGKDICAAILRKLLENEERDANRPKGLKWFYWFFQTIPTL